VRNDGLIPLLNVLVGICLMFLTHQQALLSQRIQYGIITGLAAAGVYAVCTSFRKI